MNSKAISQKFLKFCFHWVNRWCVIKQIIISKSFHGIKNMAKRLYWLFLQFNKLYFGINFIILRFELILEC